jgi:hypothetical protein
VEKYFTAGTPQVTIWRMRIAYLSLQTHSQDMWYLLTCHYNNACKNAPIYYAKRKMSFVFWAQHSIVRQSLLISEAPRSHSIKHTTLGRNSLDKWSAGRRNPWQPTTFTRDRRPWSRGIRALNSSKRATAHPRRRALGHCDWRLKTLL